MGADRRGGVNGGSTVRPGHGLAGAADAGAFLARLVRLDPATVVRLRPLPDVGRTALWARLPWDVLVVRTVAGLAPADVTVVAAELLARLAAADAALPPGRDDRWRWPLPPGASRPVEVLPAAGLRRIAEAAAGTLRTAAAEGVRGRAVGQRVLRDALLDHVAVTVTPDADPTEPVEVTQRLVQGVVRMGFLGPAEVTGAQEVQVRVAGRWVGLVGPYGAAWSRKVSDLAIRPARDQPKV
ncbi:MULTISPECIES: hypothetical protein [unclassified Micromonospora]|uniref:hypothetical protein n=1 Tax=unclassified Micromonospora TaxID=2617518 RepID=UPI001C5D6F0A|nr:hypothetical protein [Micromonospora sp. RL09-050-HVF-A]MBW4702789.1 hypothetical protein [Micromonospora sp. RL09-050-HVF-A]